MKDFLKNRRCPSVNGIFFPDNSVWIMDVSVIWMPETVFIVKPKKKVFFSDLKFANWSDCISLNEYAFSASNLNLFVGEGNYGSDGFVSLSEGSNLKWVAFFQESNPFCSAKIVGNEVHANSTIDFVWKFPINEPECCAVDSISRSKLE